MDKRNMGGARSSRKALGANLKKSDIDYKNVDLLSKFVSQVSTTVSADGNAAVGLPAPAFSEGNAK